MDKRRLLLFMLGQLGLMLLLRYFFQWILRFSDTPAGEGTLFVASTVGAVLLGFRIFDGVTDPLVGALSDWWVRKGKTRQSLLWIGFLLPSIGLVFCFSASETMSAVVRWTFLSSGLVIFFVGYTLYAIPYWSLVQDYGRESESDRRQLSNMLGLGIIVATIAGFVISPIVIDLVGYKSAAYLFAVIGAILMLGPIFAAPESEAEQVVDQLESGVSPLGAFLLAFKNREFLKVLTLLAGSQMSFTILTASVPFVVIDLLSGSEKDVSLLLGSLILTSVPMFYFIPALSAKLGWRMSLRLATGLLGLMYLLCSFTGISVIYSPYITALIMFAFCGPMIAVLLALEAEAITACARSDGSSSAVSMYFGVYNLLVKGLNGVALFITGILIDASKGPWGSGATRFMIISAAILLFCGLLGSFLIPRAK